MKIVAIPGRIVLSGCLLCLFVVFTFSPVGLYTSTIFLFVVVFSSEPKIEAVRYCAQGKGVHAFLESSYQILTIIQKQFCALKRLHSLYNLVELLNSVNKNDSVIGESPIKTRLYAYPGSGFALRANYARGI